MLRKVLLERKNLCLYAAACNRMPWQVIPYQTNPNHTNRYWRRAGKRFPLCAGSFAFESIMQKLPDTETITTSLNSFDIQKSNHFP